MVTQTEVPSFEDTYRAQRPGMVRLAHMLIGSNALAEEIVQDAFLELHRRWDRVANPKAYVTRTVVNRTRSYHRRVAVERRHPQTPPEPALPPEIDETWQALRHEPLQRRTALVLRYYEDRSISEIAELMNVRPGTVKSLIHRGLQSLKEQLS